MKRGILSIAVIFILQCGYSQDEKSNRLKLGFNGGLNISRVSNNDTFAPNFSRRNRLGPSLGLNGIYDINDNIGIAFSINAVSKGYKINNDTLNSEPDITRKFWSLTVPLGLHFKQQFNAQSFIVEKFGIVANYNFRKDSTTLANRATNPNFKVTEVSERNFYPMFYLGFGIGGMSENDNRYEFGITYMQSLSRDAFMRVKTAPDYKTAFPLTYRGGFLLLGFTYYFNISNFKKSRDYFY
jgi:hypothetical protein